MLLIVADPVPALPGGDVAVPLRQHRPHRQHCAVPAPGSAVELIALSCLKGNSRFRSWFCAGWNVPGELGNPERAQRLQRGPARAGAGGTHSHAKTDGSVFLENAPLSKEKIMVSSAGVFCRLEQKREQLELKDNFSVDFSRGEGGEGSLGSRSGRVWSRRCPGTVPGGGRCRAPASCPRLFPGSHHPEKPACGDGTWVIRINKDRLLLMCSQGKTPGAALLRLIN